VLKAEEQRKKAEHKLKKKHTRREGERKRVAETERRIIPAIILVPAEKRATRNQ